jgi:hypothetical protein
MPHSKKAGKVNIVEWAEQLKAENKLDPITQKHIWWVEKKLPPHSK